MDSAIFAIAGP